MNRKILAFYSPYPGAGKSTAAEYLFFRAALFARYSFATPLYHIVNGILSDIGADGVKVYRDKSRPLAALGGACPRDLLIGFGREGRAIYPDIWVNCMKNRIKNNLDIVIDDLRFPNEYAMLRTEGAKIVRLTNPGREIVPSETEALLEGYEFDAELVNEKQDIETYHAQLDTLVKELWAQ